MPGFMAPDNAAEARELILETRQRALHGRAHNVEGELSAFIEIGPGLAARFRAAELASRRQRAEAQSVKQEKAWRMADRRTSEVTSWR